MMMPRKPPTLVVLQLTGGNDALNTVVPYGNPLYYDQRPTVRVPEDQVLPIDDDYGFHPSMAAIKPFWDRGTMAIVTGIGYPKPDYSHFRSMDIWYTAQPETMATDGWLGKLVRGLDPKADNVWNDESLSAVPTRHPHDPVGEVLRYMGQTGLDAQKGAAILRTAVEQYRSSV